MKLSAADAGWLHMEEPCNLMMIAALLEFSAPLPRAELEEVVRDRLLVHERFRSCVDDRGGLPRWRPVEVNLDHHLCYEELEGRGALAGRLNELLSQPLDRAKPLWQFHVLQFEGRCALVARLHHALGDGVALMRTLMNLADVPEPDPVRPAGPRPKLGAWYRAILRLLGLALTAADPATPIKGPLGHAKKAAWSRPMALTTLKHQAHDQGVTLNDWLMARLTGALRAYLRERGACLPDSVCLRAVVPVDLRQAGEEEPGNRFGLVFLNLPVGTSCPGERLSRVKSRLDELKDSPEAAAVYALIRLVGWLPASWEHRLVSFFGSKATLVATNLPGPRRPLTMAGIRLEHITYWVPTSGRLALGVSFVSYAGNLHMGVFSDAARIPDPERIVALFEQRKEPCHV